MFPVTFFFFPRVGKFLQNFLRRCFGAVESVLEQLMWCSVKLVEVVHKYRNLETCLGISFGWLEEETSKECCVVHTQLALCMATPASLLLFWASLGSQKLVALPTVFSVMWL